MSLVNKWAKTTSADSSIVVVMRLLIAMDADEFSFVATDSPVRTCAPVVASAYASALRVNTSAWPLATVSTPVSACFGGLRVNVDSGMGRLVFMVVFIGIVGFGVRI